MNKLRVVDGVHRVRIRGIEGTDISTCPPRVVLNDRKALL